MCSLGDSGSFGFGSRGHPLLQCRLTVNGLDRDKPKKQTLDRKKKSSEGKYDVICFLLIRYDPTVDALRLSFTLSGIIFTSVVLVIPQSTVVNGTFHKIHYIIPFK